MTVLVALPTEVIAVILSLLDIPSVLRCQRVCKRLNQIATSSAVCKSLCHKAGYLALGQTLEDLRKPLVSQPLEPSSSSSGARNQCDGEKYSAWRLSGRRQEELASYKTLLVSSWKLDYVKDNADLSKAGGFNYSLETEPWRIKIDPIDRLIFATSSAGPRMPIVDMDTGWPAMVNGGGDNTAHTHLEYDQGWAVYTTRDDAFHISCLERNFLPGEEAKRAHLFPRGSLKPVHPVNAYRLIFPYLLVGSRAGYLTLYHIVTKKGVIDVPLRQRGRISIQYVEFDDDYLWVCLSSTHDSTGPLETYCRRTGRFLWAISPESPIARGARGWQLYPARQAFEEEDDKIPATSQTGRDPMALDPLGGEATTWLTHWDAVHPDPKTGSLCLVSGHSLAIFPGYKHFAEHVDEDGQVRMSEVTNKGVVLTDSCEKLKRDLPPWMRERSGEPQSYLAVADGRAAFIAKNGVALVDIGPLLSETHGTYNAEYEARGCEPTKPFRRLDKCVNVYSSPYVFKSNMFKSSCLVMTATHLAWVGSYQAIEEREIQGDDLMGCAPSKVFHSEQRGTVMWIDFGLLRENKEDKKRAREETWRNGVLEACKTEMERRIQANDGKYQLRTGRKIADITSHYKDLMDTVALLLNLGEFADLRRWIDPDRVKQIKRTKSAINKFNRQVSRWERAREENWNPFNPPMSYDYVIRQGEAEEFETDEGDDDDWHAGFAAGHGMNLLDMLMNGGGAAGFTQGMLGLHPDDDEDMFEAGMDDEDNEWEDEEEGGDDEGPNYFDDQSGEDDEEGHEEHDVEEDEDEEMSSD